MGEAQESNWTPVVNEACSFPIFNTAFDGEDSHRSIPIELISHHQIAEFIEKNGIELPQLLQVAWAFLLRSYIGTDRPLFKFFTGKHPSPESHGVLCALNLEEDKEIVHLARGIVCCNNPLPRNEIKRPDTAVIWNCLDVAHSSSVSIEAQSQDDACKISLHYWTSILLEEQALHVASIFSQTAVELVKEPRLSSMNLCTAETIRQLGQWNSEPPMSMENCVHDLILEKCKTQPEAPAVSAWDGELTYYDLEDLSNRLAVQLTHHGVCPERFVGLYFEKSKWATVAMLAVMRAGGAFAFLDLSIPQSRIQGMCKELTIVLILSSRHLTADVTGLAPQVVPVDNEQLHLTPSSADLSQQPSLLANPRNALFAQLTSGSTGIPKGVVINHSSYCSGQNAFAHYVGLNDSSRVLQFASYAFDVSVQEVLTTLIVGGCICVASETVRKWNIPQAVSQFRVNYLILTPTVAQLLQPSDIPSVKTLVLAGEPVLPSDIATWQCHVRLANMYGPAECCVSTTGHIITRGERESGVVGSGIGARCWITDAQDYQKLVPIGAVGELLIEGPIVGRGYIGDLGKTNASFVPSPRWRSAFPDNVYGRMYRTGDLAQYVSHGKVRIIGRRDEQVKLHGQRLELSEVEHHMRDAFAVKQTVAGLVIPAESGGVPILAGFILNPEDRNAPTCGSIFAAPSQGFQILAQTAVAKLSERLPAYMVPSVMIPTKTFPITRTGKTDRAQLRIEASKHTRAQLEEFSGVMAEKQAPITQMEKLLHRLIEEVLHVKDFGMNDNFFALGGDSVLAMRLTKIARDDAGVELPGEMIFRAPVLSDLAKLMRGSKGTAKVAPFSLLASPEFKEHLIRTALRSCNLSSVEDIEDIYPCTPLQEGIMALSISSSVAKYVTRSVFHIPRAIDIENLKSAWTMVLNSNPVLRTRIIQTGSDVAFQVVVRHNNLWHLADNLKSYIEQDERKAIQLGSPLTRFALIQNNGRTYMVLTIHHSLYDGWSLPRAFQQVEEAYYGITPRSQPFRIFVDYFLKLNMNQMSAFWRNELENFSGPLFPQPPSGDHTYRPATLHKMSRLIPISQATKTLQYSLATMIELSWALTLSQYSGTDDIVFGSTLAGRNVAVSGIDGILGPTLTTIPRRIRLDRSMQLEDTLRLIQERNAEYLNFGYLGLQRIAALGAGPATACKFQSLLIIQPFYDEYASTIFNNCMEELSTETVDNYILTLEVKLGKEDAVRLEVEYDAEIITNSLMSRILEQLYHNLNAVVQSGDKSLSELEPVNQNDLQTLLVWNNHVPEAINCCVHDIINRKCWSQPQASAVIAWDGKLSYEELERYSTMLAAHLQRLNVYSETYVMVYVGKSLWTVVAMLAVMKAGGAFVLVDPAQPLMRLRKICEDTQARIVITSGQYMSKAIELNLQVVEIDRGYDWESGDMHLKGPAVSPDHVVYAVFTSGSTGRPKGVAIQHHAFITSAIVNGGKQHITKHSRVLQLASFTFDASIAEILYPLVHGGCVCIPSESDSRNNLDQAINDFEITWATLTPSLARVLDPKKVRTLRTLALGGEAMTKLDVTMWADRVQLVNGYGPAECSVDAIIQPSINRGSDPANIGRGAAAVPWVVDPNNPEKLRPIGAPGELLVEGPILAKGYLQDLENTSSAFIHYPKWLRRIRHGREGRLYRTGDLVQYSAQADGSLRYLGRIDHQVKLRGQRIELGEVEQHLSECLPEAKQIVVDIVTLADPGAHAALAAFILLNDVPYCEDSVIVRASASFRLQSESAKCALKSRLPNFMIPALFLPVSKIPLSPTGKTDRLRLRECLSAFSRKDLRAYRFSEPTKRHASSTEESVLQNAVSFVLQLPLDEIGMDDNFFHLGGDSILAMRLVGYLRESAFTITVGEIFNYPSLVDLALIVHHEASSSLPAPIAPFSLLGSYTHMDLITTAARECGVDRDDIEDMYPCTPMQEALMALSIKQQEDYVLKLAFDLPRNIDFGRLKSAWNAVFNANPILRTRIIAVGLGSNDSYQVVLREELQFSSDLAPLLVTDGQPLCKISISHNDNCVQLHLWLHHSLYDGSSLSTLLKQADEAYKGAELSPCPFNAFAEYVRSTDAVSSKIFWADEFQDLSATMFPPLQKRPNIPSSRESVSHNIALQQAVELDFTLSTFIHLACSIVLGHYTASDDIVYGLTLSGRNAPVAGIEDLTGPTIATVPFRTQLPASCTTKECLSQIQNRLIRIIPYEQTGLQNIRQINQETAAACDFQCHIVIQPTDERLEHADDLFKEPPLEEDIYSNFASSPLVLIFTLSADKKNLRLTSNFDLSHLSCIEAKSFSHQLDHVLQQIIRDQNLAIKEIDVISPEDMARLSGTNMTTPHQVDRLVHDLVFESCHMQPAKIAIDSWDGLFSYAELYEASSRLAQHFLSIGIGAHPVTIICMEKSRWTVSAILAVLQTGSACALIDPSHPRSRMKSLIDQSNVRHAVVSPTTKHLMVSICESVVTVSESVLDAAELADPLTAQMSYPTDPAFVIFTSGSTGTPKGIVLEHRSIATGLKNLRACLNLEKPSRVLQFSSYAFDASLMEIFGSLTSGSTMFIPSDDDRTSKLAGFINEHQINWVFMTPSASSLLLPSEVPSLKTFALGGEPLTSTLVDRWSRKSSLINVYGPAECTFAVAVGKIPETGWLPGTIGPMVNGAGWITTPSNPDKLAAWGAIGELLIEGPILSREYIADPEKTAASFVHNPPWISHFRGPGETRLYRTGDLVQYTDDGLIKYVGRKDRQVKLNGQRIELEEIESHLRTCLPPHADVIVEFFVPRLASTRSQQLCAFICMTGCRSNVSSISNDDSILASPNVAFHDLSQKAKQQLSLSLPRYMVPETYIPLNFVPFTGTGKTNRRLLCKLAASLDSNQLNGLASHAQPLQPPSTEIETILIDLWAELLEVSVKKISASDNFLHIGGDSVLAMRLTAIARRRGLRLTVPTIFSHPVLSDMAFHTTKADPDLQTYFQQPFSLLKESTEDIFEAVEHQCSIEKGSIEDAYPCTPLQEGLVSLSIRTPGAYLAHFSYKLAKNVDIAGFRKAWQEVANANPILRTRIMQAGSLFQVVLREELSWISIGDVDNYVSDLSNKEMHLGEPLLQLAATEPTPNGAREFVLAIHHVLYDGWSLPIILDQVKQAYEGYSVPASLFSRFIDYIARSDVEQTREYWRTQLQGSNRATFPSLPSADYKPFTDMTVRKSVRLKPLLGLTSATILQLAWALLISQYSDSTDVVFGLTLSGRNASLEGIESVTGPAITAVPLRFQFQSEESVLQVLLRLQEQVVAMASFEQFGLQNIRRLGGDAEAACHFQNLLLIQPSVAKSADEFWIPVERATSSGYFSTYALEVTCDLSDTEATISFDFDQRVLVVQQAERILSQFVHLVQIIQNDPGASISDAKSLDPSAHTEIMNWNGVLPEAVERCVHEGIKQQCLESPDKLAVCAWDGDFTYKELDRLSLKLAVKLQAQGVGPEAFVPIMAEKTRWVSIAILGVIRAGGAFVLIDPSVPFQRLQTVFQDVSARTVVSSVACADVARQLAPTIVPVSQDILHEDRIASTLVEKVTPRNALYVIFTSGSTGKPKGIVTEHAAFYTSGRAQQKALYLNSNTRALQFASHMFDVSVADYLWTFLAGGCVCVASQGSLRNDLPGVMREFGINSADLTPSVARMLSPDEIPTLETVLLGGESLSQHDVQTWAGKVQLVNGYGPSECSVSCVLADVNPDSDPSNIGKTYGILSWIVDKDDHNKLVPIGAVGELVLEGHILARGYLNEPDKTAAAFIESSPSWLQGLRPSSRLYKTGDLVQYNADGTLRYIGRKDTQVKIRGQRVELGEIEHQIMQTSPTVQDVVVELIEPTQRARPVLAAFVFDKARVASECEEDHRSALFLSSDVAHLERSQEAMLMLQKRLPSYMVPAVFIPLLYMPISSSGKADRRLLREQAAALSRGEIEAYTAGHVAKRPPRTLAEQSIQAVMAEVIHIEVSDVGLDDDFFSLGGDSIIAIRFVARARMSGFTFKVTDVFKSPKLSDLALLVEESRVTHEGSDITLSQYLGFPRKEDLVQMLTSETDSSFPPGEIMDVLPVSQSAERFLLQPPEYWVLNLEGPVDRGQLQSMCTALVERHAILRTIFISRGPTLLQVVLSGINSHMHDYGTTPSLPEFVEKYRQDDDISVPTLNNPVTRFAFAKDPHGKMVFIMRLSHAQFDGYCLHILWKDLKQLYEGISLPPPAEYSAHMKQWISSQTENAFTFWNNTLEGSTVSRIDNTIFNGRSDSQQTETQFITSTQRIYPEQPPHEVTTATIVKSAWSFLLSQLLNTEDVVFAQTSNGRSNASPSTQDVVGPCLNFIPVRAKLQPSWTVLDLMQFLQHQHQESLDYELLDFRQIVERSTSWPNGTTHQSNLVHQNIEPDLPFAFGEAQAQVTCSYEWPRPPDEILIESRPVEDGGLQITLDTLSGILDQQNADWVVDRLCRIISLFLVSAEESLERLESMLLAN